MSEKDNQKENKDLNSLKKERDEYLDGWKRAKADLINYKKEELSRLEQIAKFSNEDLVIELIQVLDNFELALSTLEKDGKVDKGVYMIKSQIEEILKRRGLESMEVEEGEEFDPTIHDAIANISTEEDLDNKIAEQVERGYVLHGKIIRAAKVKVYKKK
ncbi:MAG: nucleotide exchange factor GrpE [Candidatus Colwellbacteria bacterium CG10_big_fil_rev_8_21_14_0_10_41_28]|uniref:Protein GrpE n=1 Tax=Candidatus Colwellbacteria bacterium CG10_big_fil_rev_8_21_14_0_10_41_28 TaxID=1974539 RepID=A0A2H0VHE8_9BACT|nr:MAG: nucleotide exchange factor GrpE [Candidatus Colwellbacteria bacterium CG10_big_fil_rev_8_21_14_0_10_41_28]